MRAENDDAEATTITGDASARKCMKSHAGFLLLAGTRTAILASGLVELPCQVEKEGATRRIKYCHLARTIQDSLGLVGILYVVATQIEGKRTQTAQVDVVLYTDIETSLRLQQAEVANITLR